MVPWNLSGCAWCVTKCKQVRKLIHIQFKTGYYANTEFTSTEFTPTYVSQKVKGQMNSLNYTSDLAHDHLNVLDSNETTSTHSWHLKQWDHGSINLQWDLMQLWTNTKHVLINHSGTTNCGLEEWEQMCYQTHWTKISLNWILVVTHLIGYVELKNIVAMQRKISGTSNCEPEKWKQTCCKTH